MHRKWTQKVGAHCGHQLYLSSTIIVSTVVPFGALLQVCFSGYFCNLSLADTVSLVKSAEGQIIGLAGPYRL